MQRQVIITRKGRDVPLHDRPGRLRSEGDERERQSVLMQALTRYGGVPCWNQTDTLGPQRTRPSHCSTSYSVLHLERGAPGGIDGAAPGGGARPSFGGASFDWDRAFSGSTTISGSTLGGGMADLGLGTVSGIFWIPGSMLLGGGIGAGVVGGIGSPGRPGTGGVGLGGMTSAAMARLEMHMAPIISAAAPITCIFKTPLMLLWNGRRSSLYQLTVYRLVEVLGQSLAIRGDEVGTEPQLQLDPTRYRYELLR